MKALEKARKDKGFSQEFVARQLGVSRATIDNWERGTTKPTLPMAAKLAELLDVPLQALAEE